MCITGHHQREQECGCLLYLHHVVLGLDEVDCLFHTATLEPGTCGLTTPFLFSSLALDINSSGVCCLIQAFLRTCVSFPAPDAERTWHEETHFAAPAEPAMCLRWGLAQVLSLRAMPCEASSRGICMSSRSEAELGKPLPPPPLYTQH